MALGDADRIAAARAYVDALVSHDIAGVRVHPACTRTELGVRTGRNGAHILASLQRGPQFRLIHAISGFTAEMDDDGTVRTSYHVHVRPKALGLAATVIESFEVDDDGRLTAIVARFSAPHRRPL